PQFEVLYQRHGLICTSGRLKRRVKPKPLVTKLVLPAVQPLPTGTATVTLPDDWSQGMGGLAVTGSAVWAPGELGRIAPAANAFSGPLTTPAPSAGDMTTGEGSVWASDYSYDLVRRYDQATGRLLAVIQLPAGSSPEGLTDANGAIWVANHHSGTISRIDPAT